MEKQEQFRKYCSCLKSVEGTKGYNAYAVCRSSVHGLEKFGRIACFPYPHEVPSKELVSKFFRYGSHETAYALDEENVIRSWIVYLEGTKSGIPDVVGDAEKVFKSRVGSRMVKSEYVPLFLFAASILKKRSDLSEATAILFHYGSKNTRNALSALLKLAIEELAWPHARNAVMKKITFLI